MTNEQSAFKVEKLSKVECLKYFFFLGTPNDGHLSPFFIRGNCVKDPPPTDSQTFLRPCIFRSSSSQRKAICTPHAVHSLLCGTVMCVIKG